MHASAGRINLSLYILCLLMCRGGCSGSAGDFRQQQPRWGSVGSLWLSPAFAGRADVMFGHWFPPHIRFLMLRF